MIISSKCAPTLIFIGFSLIQIIIDLYKGVINDAFIKFIVMIIFSVILNILCNLGYKIVAWFIVFIPIIMMTLITTLLLKVFGTNPDEKDLRTRIKEVNNDFLNKFMKKDDEIYYNGANLLNHQKNNHLNDNFNTVERIDRNKHRRDLYDDVETVYNLNSAEDDLYDLSNNPIKYTIVDKFINIFGENIFTHQVSRLLNINYPYKISNLSYYSNPSNITNFKPDYEVRLDKMYGSDFESYEKKYNETYLLDGQILFRRNKYKKTKENYPNLNQIDINRIIDNEWNNLTGEQQQRWNTTAEKEENKNNINYNPYYFRNKKPTPGYEILSSKYSNNEPCPINETKQSFKQKTGLNCYEVCPPGKERNSMDVCVKPCPSGQERKIINGDCEYI
tara:strand:- start:1870 stop:3039 length:1170 start_codon:yes stop_codon:yes gene_type:complete